MSLGGGGDGRVGEDWRKDADTHMMRPEHVKAAGVDASKRPPGHHPGTVMHQRRRLPYSYTTMALAGFAISLALGYVVLYANKRRDASAGDVARAAMGTGGRDDGGTPTTVRNGVPPRK
ncbi:hypothetical protein Droror1_Dr00016949 [Drosera rotundifolia]